jgi:hypothetical protein
MSGSRHLSKTMVELRLKQKALHDKLYTLERQIFALETASVRLFFHFFLVISRLF